MDAEQRLEALSASDGTRLIRAGRFTSRQLVEACLAEIERREPAVKAWQFFDRDYALAQADACDDTHRRGAPLGPLHGIPVGIKDICDTCDMPTENGSVLHAGRRPQRDAAAVALLRAAGAVIMGKTVTTEFANMHPGKTTNPHNAGRTPGGSSSGSAAAVAAHMVPLAIGSQTGGSVIRPAAFCGIVGFKPTRGLIPRTGVLQLSRFLDQLGVFARTVEDAALIAECMVGFDAGDPYTRPQARPQWVAAALEEPPSAPKFAFVKSSIWDKASADTQAAFAELVDKLGGTVEPYELPSAFAHAHEWHRTICDTEIAVNLAQEYEQGRDKLSAGLCKTIEHGRSALAFDYARALAAAEALDPALDELFFAYDAVITPAAPGVAPLGLDTTGSPMFNRVWTLVGTPAVTLPLLVGEDDMPMGVQLVGARGDDARLLRTARWLTRQLGMPA